ncbi:MAG: hypothetical protein FDZ75_01920 [Actinobacteria bacterium]|nr:MAG: hypothetical protein FDZ75_01920 [Actinomycetota bacterium]
MPIWVVISFVVGALLLAGAAVALGVLGWRGYRRRALLRLVVRLEGVEAAGQALLDVVTHLAGASDEELEAFADDADSVDRHALDEVRARASLIADEIDHMPFPASLIPAAEHLADAAFVTAREAGRVGPLAFGPDALERLGDMDLALSRAYVRQARTSVLRACQACGLEDTAVYGGGLYL